MTQVGFKCRALAGIAVAALATTTALVGSPSGAHAAPAKPLPGVRLLTGVNHLEVDRFEGQPQLYLSDVAFLAATNGDFELDAERAAHGITVKQVGRRNGKSVVLRHIHLDGAGSMINGLPNFFTLTLRTAAGAFVATEKVPFCPSESYDSERVDPHSVANPTFPQTCGDTLTRLMPWGINNGWASGVSTSITASKTRAPDGKYSVQVAITPTYARQFGLTQAESSVTESIDLKTETGGCGAGVCPQASTASAAEPHSTQDGTSSVNVPITGHHKQLLPDLESLPAHDLSMQNLKGGRSILGFGATIWDRGPGTFDVEGFRQGHHPKMLARQYIDRPGKSPKVVDIGHFEFDTRQGHHHWHLEDVAQYALLNSGGTKIIRSEKQSFCLAPTDPINLLKPGSTWNPSSIGLESSCPTDQGIWLREVLPVGWGDTYYQSVAGQAFNITGLANGTYYLRVRANPFGHIHETTLSNDTSYLEVALGGTPGARTFKVANAVNRP